MKGVVWGPAEPGAWNDDNVWAPDVFEDEGQYYLYYSANMRIGVAVADDPTGPFVDVYDQPFIGTGHGGVPFLAIDAHAFRDDDGALYLYTTGYHPFSFIRVFTMVDPVTVNEDWTELIGPKFFGWETFINEGAWIVKHGGVYYLMYSGNDVRIPFYAIGYAMSDSPLGPFVKYERNPILHVNWEHEFYGPGHNSAVEGPDGDLWIFYHTKLNPGQNLLRRVRKNRLRFTGDGQLWVDIGLGPPPPFPVDDDDQDDEVEPTDDDTGDGDAATGDDDDSTASDDDDDDDSNGCGC
ncbi:MAG: family 43 glycosylhydrolase [Deltaproteobacteria bacterium]|nr:family 43 glycosylhydrolase [Deltaproteobacteria bacterium]